METEFYKAQGVRYCVTPQYNNDEGADNTLCEQRTIELLNQLSVAFLPVTLILEDNNALDPNAVAVYYMGNKVAYLQKADAKDLRSHLDSQYLRSLQEGKPMGAPFCCRILRVEVSAKGWFFVEKPKICASDAHLLPACEWDSSLSINSQEFQLELKHFTDVFALEQTFAFILQPLFEQVLAASSSEDSRTSAESSSSESSSSPAYDSEKLGELLDQKPEPLVQGLCESLEAWMEKVWYIFTNEVTCCVKNFKLCLSACKHPKLVEIHQKLSSYEPRRASATSLGRLRKLWQNMVQDAVVSKAWKDYLKSQITQAMAQMKTQSPQTVLSPLSPQSPLSFQGSLSPQGPLSFQRLSHSSLQTVKRLLDKLLAEVNEKLSKLPPRLLDLMDDAPQLILAMNYYDPPQQFFHGVVSLLVQRMLIMLEQMKLNDPATFLHPQQRDYKMEDWVKNAKVPVSDIVDFVKRNCHDESSAHTIKSLLHDLKAKDYGLSLSDIEEACQLPEPSQQPSSITLNTVEKLYGTFSGDVGKQEISP